MIFFSVLLKSKSSICLTLFGFVGCVRLICLFRGLEAKKRRHTRDTDCHTCDFQVVHRIASAGSLGAFAESRLGVSSKWSVRSKSSHCIEILLFVKLVFREAKVKGCQIYFFKYLSTRVGRF